MKKRAAVFGCGVRFQETFSSICNVYDVVVCADNNPDKWNKKYCGITCVSVDSLWEYSFEILIISVFWKQLQQEMYEQVKDKCTEKQITILYVNECCFTSFEKTNIGKELEYHDDFSNEISIAEKSSIGHIKIVFQGCNNRIILEKGIRVRNDLFIHCKGDANYIRIGENTTMGGMKIHAGEPGKILIGEDCMFSSEITLLQNPGHPIYDLETKQRTNSSKSIEIGSHVWIGRNASLLNGFSIGSGSVIGYGTVSSGTFGSNLVIAGNPAKVVREGIFWQRTLQEINHE